MIVCLVNFVIEIEEIVEIYGSLLFVKFWGELDGGLEELVGYVIDFDILDVEILFEFEGGVEEVINLKLKCMNF